MRSGARWDRRAGNPPAGPTSFGEVEQARVLYQQVSSSWPRPARSQSICLPSERLRRSPCYTPKQTVPEIDNLIETLAHPPFRSVKNLSVAGDRRHHRSNGDVWIPESTYKDSWGT